MLKFNSFLLPEKSLVKAWVSPREGEVRIGELVNYRNQTDSWKQSTFHILGVCESVGPQLNGGKTGAQFAFEAFVTRFLNTQSNEFIDASQICLHGYLSLNDDSAICEDIVLELDEWISEWARSVVESGGFPIVVGGGHNNAFPLIKGLSVAHNQAVNVVNMDPHADVRKADFRHSGNSFSFAYEQGYLSQYAVLGLHQPYNNQYILDFLKKWNADMTFFEDWIDDFSRFEADISQIFQKFYNSNLYFGLELDMDAIEFMPSSAYTPSGISVNQARLYIRKIASLPKVGYLNLTEGAPTNALEEQIVGKTLSYLVLDFIKTKQKHSNPYI